jgi:hypothetical protein
MSTPIISAPIISAAAFKAAFISRKGLRYFDTDHFFWSGRTNLAANEMVPELSRENRLNDIRFHPDGGCGILTRNRLAIRGDMFMKALIVSIRFVFAPQVVFS